MRRFRSSSIDIRREFFAVVTVVGFVLSSVCLGYSGGLGEPNDPYHISDVNDLMALAGDVNDYNKCFILAADIDLDPNLPGNQIFTAAVIAPDNIRGRNHLFQGTSFTGYFNGNNFRILNLTIDTNSLSRDYLGLFGRTDANAIIVDLGLENTAITGGDDPYYLGGLVAYNYRGNITNCYVEGYVNPGSESRHLGGLVGYNNEGNITDCYVTGDVMAGISSRYLGGLVGTDIKGSINNCYAIVSLAGASSIGGLVGYSVECSIINCYAAGSLLG